MPAPAVTRVVFSAADLRARDIRQEPVRGRGSRRFARMPSATPSRAGRATRPALPAVGTGSHIDAIPNAGQLRRHGRRARRTGGDPRAAARRLPPAPLDRTADLHRRGADALRHRLPGQPVARRACSTPAPASACATREGHTLDRGARSRRVSRVALDGRVWPRATTRRSSNCTSSRVRCWNATELPLGIVTAIAAPAALRLTIEGEGGHAGAVLMPDRHDAFLAAAEIALARRSGRRDRPARSIPSATVGSLRGLSRRGQQHPQPGAPGDSTSAIPTRRGATACSAASIRRLREIAARRGVHVQARDASTPIRPRSATPKIVGALEAACEAHALAYQKMVSRAYHDSLFMSRIAPTAMLFIPCRGGVSHRPDEYASPEAIANGATVLAEALAKLSLLS